MKNIIKVILIVALIFLLINIDYIAIYENLRVMELSYLTYACLLQLLTMYLIAVQWSYLSRNMGLNLNFISVLNMNVKGNIVDTLTPGAKVGGELVRFKSLRDENNISRLDATVLIALQKSLSFISFIIVFTITFFLFAYRENFHYRREVILFPFILMVLVFLFFYIVKSSGLKARFKNLYKYILSYKKYFELIWTDKEILAKQLILGLIIWLIYPLKLKLITMGFKINLKYALALLSSFASYIIGLIPMLPGSLASYETSLALILKSLGIDISSSLSIALVFRFVSFWFEFIVSVILVGLIKLFENMKRDDIYGEIKS